jgi:hypothetical protein
MYMAYVKSKRMGSKKRKARKTRRIKGGGNQNGKTTIEDAIVMVDNLKEFLKGMKTNSAPPAQSEEEAEVQVEAQSESKSGDQV